MALTDRNDKERSIDWPSADDMDITMPSPARMYDYYLGGKDNFPADREAAEKALSVVPCGWQVAWANRKFLVRAVRYLARKSIDQFLDLGTGIPTSPNVHEVARSIIPGAKVAYVDNDPIVIVHDRALLASTNEGITAARGDVRYPLNILSNHTVRQVVDFNRPVGVLFVAVLHFMTNNENPYESVAAFRDRVPVGSYVVISHITSDGTEPDVVATIEEIYAQASAPAVFRSKAEIGRLFDGFELVKPGLVEVSGWRGNNRKPANPPALRFLGGVGRKR
jgi:S-adenosyl methyltransferase